MVGRVPSGPELDEQMDAWLRWRSHGSQFKFTGNPQRPKEKRRGQHLHLGVLGVKQDRASAGPTLRVGWGSLACS